MLNIYNKDINVPQFLFSMNYLYLFLSCYSYNLLSEKGERTLKKNQVKKSATEHYEIFY